MQVTVGTVSRAYACARGAHAVHVIPLPAHCPEALGLFGVAIIVQPLGELGDKKGKRVPLGQEVILCRGSHGFLGSPFDQTGEGGHGKYLRRIFSPFHQLPVVEELQPGDVLTCGVAGQTGEVVHLVPQVFAD